MRDQLSKWVIVAAMAIGKVRARLGKRVHHDPVQSIPCSHSIWYGCNCDDCRARRLARHARLIVERMNLIGNIARTEVELDSKRPTLQRRIRLFETNERRHEQLGVLDAKLARDRELWDSEGRALGNTRASVDLARKLKKLGGAA